MLKFLIVLIALVGLNQIEANVFVFGSCAKSPVIADFDITKVNILFSLNYKFNIYLKNFP